jgi:hypothetical protein
MPVAATFVAITIVVLLVILELFLGAFHFSLWSVWFVGVGRTFVFMHLVVD